MKVFASLKEPRKPELPPPRTREDELDDIADQFMATLIGLTFDEADSVLRQCSRMISEQLEDVEDQLEEIRKELSKVRTFANT